MAKNLDILIDLFKRKTPESWNFAWLSRFVWDRLSNIVIHLCEAIGDAFSFCARQRENPSSFTVELLNPSFIRSCSSYCESSSAAIEITIFGNKIVHSVRHTHFLCFLHCESWAGCVCAVGADNVVTEPATSINFATSLTVPGSSTELSFLGAGMLLEGHQSPLISSSSHIEILFVSPHNHHLHFHLATLKSYLLHTWTLSPLIPSSCNIEVLLVTYMDTISTDFLLLTIWTLSPPIPSSCYIFNSCL